jgi:hypothetical protein
MQMSLPAYWDATWPTPGRMFIEISLVLDLNQCQPQPATTTCRRPASSPHPPLCCNCDVATTSILTRLQPQPTTGKPLLQRVLPCCSACLRPAPLNLHRPALPPPPQVPHLGPTAVTGGHGQTCKSALTRLTLCERAGACKGWSGACGPIWATSTATDTGCGQPADVGAGGLEKVPACGE